MELPIEASIMPLTQRWFPSVRDNSNYSVANEIFNDQDLWKIALGEHAK